MQQNSPFELMSRNIIWRGASIMYMYQDKSVLCKHFGLML